MEKLRVFRIPPQKASKFWIAMTLVFVAALIVSLVLGVPYMTKSVETKYTTQSEDDFATAMRILIILGMGVFFFGSFISAFSIRPSTGANKHIFALTPNDVLLHIFVRPETNVALTSSLPSIVKNVETIETNQTLEELLYEPEIEPFIQNWLEGKPPEDLHYANVYINKMTNPTIIKHTKEGIIIGYTMKGNFEDVNYSVLLPKINEGYSVIKEKLEPNKE